MEEYIRRIQYYETDKMGFAHHSNYIRWFEESRLDFMDKIGVPYKSLEDMGYFCPVLSVECNYKKSVYFDDKIKIRTVLSSFENVRHSFSYEIVNIKTDELCASGRTTHCFLDKNGKVVSLKRTAPELFEKLLSFAES